MMLVAQLPPEPDLVCFVRQPNGQVKDLSRLCGTPVPLIQLNYGAPVTPITPQTFKPVLLERPPSLPPNNRLLNQNNSTAAQQASE